MFIYIYLCIIYAEFSKILKGRWMINLSISEKRALEEVYIILDERKTQKLEVFRKYFMLNLRFMRMYTRRKLLLSWLRK